MRNNLANARKKAGMTQKQTAEKVGMSLRGYQQIEQGERIGKVWLWDALEDLFGVNQRVLREDFPGGIQNEQK